MKSNDILEEIKNHTWWVEESPIIHQVAEWAWRGFGDASKLFDKKYLSLGIFIYKKDYISEATPRDEKKKQFYLAFKKYRENKNYLRKKAIFWKKELKMMAEEQWRNTSLIGKMSSRELAKAYAHHADEQIRISPFFVFLECVDPITEDDLKEIVLAHAPQIKSKELAQVLSTMCAPIMTSFMERERILMLESVLEVLSKKGDIKKLSKVLSKKYHWIVSNYGAAVFKSDKDFESDILEVIKSKKKSEIKNELNQLQNKSENLKKEKIKFTKKYHLDDYLKDLFCFIAEIGSLIDYRKEYYMQITVITYKYLEELSLRLGVPTELLGYTTLEELKKWSLSGYPTVSVTDLKKRRNYSIYLMRLVNGKAVGEFIVGKLARKIDKALFNTGKITEFMGTVASAPVKNKIGRVSIVLQTHKEKFNEGDILVTSMTRPDFLPLMRKAIAIITDEGGLTCHAAIVSRELKIPCIIGTKIATRQLKTGDSVEMDLTKGIIKIVK